MVVYAGPGILSTNEEFALKRNQAENVRLGETIDSLSIDERSSSENFKKDIKELKRTLKDIKKSTGRSPEGIRTLSSRALSGVTYASSVSYQIPKRIAARISSSKSDFIKRETAFTEIDRILRGDSGYLETGGCEIKPRAHTGDGVSHSRLRRNLSDQNIRKTKSEGYSGSTLEQLPDSYDSDSVFVDTVVEEEEKESEMDAMMKYFQKIYNPWNIRNRDGRQYDALHLPKIKDCHRPVCRPTCNTCALRKKKGPCFLIPGMVEIENREEETISKPKRRKKKPVPGSDERSETQSSADVKTVKRKCHSRKGMGISRLAELAVPKGGFRRELRFSKAFLQRSLDHMTEMNEQQQMSVYENENRRRIQSKVSTFLAYINLQTQDKQPKKMVDIPLRDDLIKHDEHCDSLPLMTKIPDRTDKSPRRVAFQ
jgi:hypothetical protein